MSGVRVRREDGVTRVTLADSCHLVPVEGTGLEPLARPGQHVIVDTSVPRSSIRDGDIVAVRTTRGRVWIRRVARKFFQEGLDEKLDFYIFTVVNPSAREKPLVCRPQTISAMHKVVGVLFTDTRPT